MHPWCFLSGHLNAHLNIDSVEEKKQNGQDIMRIDNMSNLPHPCSKKNNKPREKFRLQKCNLHLIGITQFPICYTFRLRSEKSLGLSVLSLEATVGSNKIPLSPLSNSQTNAFLADHPQMLPASTQFLWPCLTLSSTGEANTGCHLTNSEVISKIPVSLASVTNAAQLFVKY